MQHRSLLACSSFAFALVTGLAAPAAAQGTMTPNQPPPELPATGTPHEPPSAPPAANPAAPGPSNEASRPRPSRSKSTATPRRHVPVSRSHSVAARPSRSATRTRTWRSPSSRGLSSPLITDIGGKIIPELFLGAYLGANVGAVGDDVSALCNEARAKVRSRRHVLRIGILAQYHILPAGKVDPVDRVRHRLRGHSPRRHRRERHHVRRDGGRAGVRPPDGRPRLPP